MDVSPPITQKSVSTTKMFRRKTRTTDDEDDDVCRICRSPEEPGKPLRYPCLCRGSIKYVHQDCLRLWLNRSRHKKCEVCGSSYSFVPVYSENAPERLPCNEFLIGLLLRLIRYMNLIGPWILLILFNTYCNSLYPLGRDVAAEFQSVFSMSPKFASLCAGLLYSFLISCVMDTFNLMRIVVGDLNVRRFSIGNGLLQGVIGGLVNFLWKYMKILCDWYFHKLVFILGPPRPLIHVPPNAPLHEFGVIRRLLFFLDDNAFAVLAISVYVPFLFVLLPFSFGWIVLPTVGGSFLTGNSPVILGYALILSTSFAYLGILFTLGHNSFPAILRWFTFGVRFITVKMPGLLYAFSAKSCKDISVIKDAFVCYFKIDVLPWITGCWLEFCTSPWLGFHFITVKLPCLLWSFSVEACKSLYLIKHAFVLCLKIGVLPWIIGWWLEIYTYPLFGTTSSQRFEILSHDMMILPWFLGFCCLIIADYYRKLIQEIIHKRAFWYLLDVTDPDYKITKLNLGYSLFVFAFHGVLLVILTHLPIKAITRISPSFFPIELWVTHDTPFQRVIRFDLLRYGPQWLLKHVIPAMKLIVHNWILTVSSWLQLSDFMLVVPRGQDFHRTDHNVRPMMLPYCDNPMFLFYSIAEGSVVIRHEYQNAEDDNQDRRDNRFLLRIALMLVLAALSLFLFSTAFMALPLLVGRVFFDSIAFIMLKFGFKHDDICAFWIGCYILRAIYLSICFAFDHIWRGRADLLLKYIWICIRNGLLFSIWISVIPGLLGLLIDLMIIIPSRVPLNESPVYFLIQDWLIGVVVLHMWTFLALMLTPVSCFATKAWRGKFENIRNVGINSLPSMWLLRDVIGSIINTLLTSLSIPYLLAKVLFPLLGFPKSINSAVERFIWPALLALVTIWFMAKLTRDIIIYLHQVVFNERYPVGERVDNLNEHLEQGIIIHGV
ncbi:Zinc finger RING-CH-type [Arabidopsis suecica]|uniref:Zinc finger RING-CH-type n=1 Tax=Arabidopsis suecica TaxID=45249 RepID=A0A8T2FFN1_ARASU|nr:Zinc finger RING-CH-type [Arabidopsis suecica]